MLSSECMVVPPPMWRSLRAWLPLDVEHELCKDPETEEDSINAHVSRPVTLTDETGKRTYRRTCPLLQRVSPFLSMGADQWRQIRFGTRVLSAFKVVMDRDNWRVGLQEKSPEPNNDSACAARAACIGEQMYVPYTNRCADPDCSLKILFELNQETKVCEMAWWVPSAVVTAVAALVTLELFVLHLRQKVVAEACSGRQ
ncbi:Erythrocyte membrane-associated antigen, related [Eimeria mitis]|uniref:Erythrocyte membrane-associated antigen, related n=1 Tax=Eimeria mitis TaxID=44415 RepID=U6KCW6_9EIME|nr:Erythrocyte membrane-associated antigen, related [Eimeria mitis]CDJ35835.1 Erythrocyte membrane-associated antigen, related [Eimeria mitis]